MRWEALTASPEHSPGPVKDNEELRRSFIWPTHFETEDEPSPGAFADLWSHGLSVDRALYRGVEQSQEDAKIRVDQWNADNPDKPQRKLHALATVQARDLRAVEVIGARALVIFDTALAANTSHADVCAIGASTSTTKKDLRTTLWDLMRRGFVVLAAG